MVKLSFILPCYNVERYIADCLDSIFAQDMSEDEYEVICVNDCSTDGTCSVVEEYAQKHQNVVLVNHEKNQGVGAARNTGLRLVQGEYIWFVDPDDTIKQDSAPNAYQFAKQKDVDILMFNYESKKENVERRFFRDSEIYSGQDYVVTCFPGRFSEFSIVWRCLFKTLFVQQQSIEFPEISKAEDVSFLWKAMLEAKRVCSVDKVYYTHIDNPNSIAHNNIKANIAFCERVMFAYQIDSLLCDGNDRGIDAVLVDDMVRTAKWCSSSSIDLLKRMTNSELSKYYSEIVKHKREVNRIKHYMNRKYQVLYDTSLGKVYWILKAKMICGLF